MKYVTPIAALLLALTSFSASAAEFCRWKKIDVEYGATGRYGTTRYLECSDVKDTAAIAAVVYNYPFSGNSFTLPDADIARAAKTMDSLGYTLIGNSMAKKTGTNRTPGEFCTVDEDTIICTHNDDAMKLVKVLTPNLPYTYGSAKSESIRLSGSHQFTKNLKALDDLGYLPTADETIFRRDP